MSDIAEKIARIIAHADSTTHPEEAEVFMAKAHALMEAHGISLLDLGRLDQDDPVGKTQGDQLRNNSSAKWRFNLATQVANYYGCRLVGQNRGTFRYWIVFGRESGRITFELMWPFIDRQVLATARDLTRQGHYPTTKHAHKAVGDALTRRVWKLNMEKQAKPKTSAQKATSNALVPVDTIQRVIDETFPNVKKGRSTKMRDDAVARKAAEGISLNHQVKHTARKQLT
jgi:hypothetical protein